MIIYAQLSNSPFRAGSYVNLRAAWQPRVLSDFQCTYTSTFRPGKLRDVEGSLQWNSGNFFQLSYDSSASPTCKPANNIPFLKTHKTGSSTLTNILNRYGDSRDLFFALPFRGYDFKWPTPFLLKSIMPIKKTPNILCTPDTTRP